MQCKGRLTAAVAARLPVHEVAVADLEHALVVGLGLRITAVRQHTGLHELGLAANF
jgi:hypothetical protein